MKKIIYKISSVWDWDGFGNKEYTYFVNFGTSNGYFYTITATAEGFGYLLDTWEQAGIEVEKTELKEQ